MRLFRWGPAPHDTIAPVATYDDTVEVTAEFVQDRLNRYAGLLITDEAAERWGDNGGTFPRWAN